MGTGYLFIFQENPESPDETQKILFDEIKAKFESEKEEKKNESNSGGMSDEQLAKIPGLEILEKPGPKEGFVQMVRPDKNTRQVDVHQWNNGSWSLVGQAMGSAGKAKVEFEGEMYDKVFNVEIEDGGKTAQLPVNFSEDPWQIAEKFCKK